MVKLKKLLKLKEGELSKFNIKDIEKSLDRLNKDIADLNKMWKTTKKSKVMSKWEKMRTISANVSGFGKMLHRDLLTGMDAIERPED